MNGIATLRTRMPRTLSRPARRMIRRLPGPVRRRAEAELLKRALRRGLSWVPVNQLADAYGAALDDLAGANGRQRLTYFEAGVFAGESMSIMIRAARSRGLSLDAWGVDSFEGLPDEVADDEGAWTPGSFACPRPVTEWNLQRTGIDPRDIHLVEGWFDDVLTPALATQVGEVDVAMLDADAYSSTVPVLAFLTPLLADRAWLIFDDWFAGGNLDPASRQGRGTGVERAFDEWLAAQGGAWEVEQMSTYELQLPDEPHRPAGMVLRLTRSSANPAGTAPINGAHE